MSREIIDTGLVEFVLPFDRGEEKIYFNPNDIDFFIRLADMINSISKTYEKLEDDYEEASEITQKMSILKALNDKVKTAFDVAFGNNVSDIIFKYASPHAIIKSKKQYFTFYILEYLMKEIGKETGKTSKDTEAALQKAINKHAAKYPDKFKN